MNIRNNIKNFLYDKNYFISIFDNCIHLYNYEKIIKVNKDITIVNFIKFNLEIIGEELLVKKMLKNEILVEGIIKSLNINYV